MSNSEQSGDSMMIIDGYSSSTASSSSSKEGAWDLSEIMRGLEDSFAELGGWDYERPIAFSESYADVPNPALNAKDVGILGLPLGKQGAESIKGIARRRMPDSDVWELDSNEFTLDNVTSWNVFLEKAVAAVYRALHVGKHGGSGSPRCHLRKLFLIGPGSCMSPDLIPPIAGDVFAIMTVILPSPFTGGDIHFPQAKKSVVFSHSSTSLLQTAVVASYSDVKYDMKAISGGHCLALSYTLHDTVIPMQTISLQESVFLDNIRPTLEAWAAMTMAGERGLPEKVICRLDHRCADVTAGLDVLGAGAPVIRSLESMANGLGFHVGLATIEARLTGYAFKDWADSHDGVDAQDGEDWQKVLERHAEVQDFVSLDGKLIADILKYGDGETIPPDLTEALEVQNHDDEDWMKHHAYSLATSVYRWYRCTAVVIWPSRSDFAIRNGGGNLVPTCERILTFTLETPQDENRHVVEFVLARSCENPALVMQAVCHVSVLWKDAPLWVRAVEAYCRERKELDVNFEKIGEAAATLGFFRVQAGLEALLSQECRETHRLGLICAIERWMSSPNSSEDCDSTAGPWITSNVEENLRLLVADKARSTTKAIVNTIQDLLHQEAYNTIHDYASLSFVEKDEEGLREICVLLGPLLHGDIAFEILSPIVQNLLIVWTDGRPNNPPTPANPNGKGQCIDVSRWDCTCCSCNTTRSILPTSRPKSGGKTTIRGLDKSQRDHLDHMISTHLPGGQLRVTWKTRQAGVFNAQIVHKSMAIYKLRNRKLEASRKAQGEMMLSAIGPDDDRLRRVLGPHFTRILGAIRGAAAQNIAQVSGTSSTSTVRSRDDHDDLPASKRRKVLHADDNDFEDGEILG
ncbi:hypothetical protein BXZ70DRAFT_945971 [Cristinia sonorae]|uniref:Uncharacterized protein n=1 Tax=Cristinia sonorae TaxID=1940300 RepID=A0A8K0UMF0_9AGAR|nr:hypothetical protein BXZ70DRAFT_945971 [Cristinia sonorae]